MLLSPPPDILKYLAKNFQGELLFDDTTRLLYATDASVYREVPLAVAYPRNEADLSTLIGFATTHQLSLIARTAGTSLAGQVVGHGIVVDFSRHMNRILEFNPQKRWIRVQPGVILDELNLFLKPHGLYFGPETSTSNRCMIGGMVANNSCGARSLIYGSTRDHTLQITALLSDGSKVCFESLDQDAFLRKCTGNKLESKLYHQISHLLSDPATQQEIREQYPDSSLHRRNTGYALDILLQSNIFSQQGPDFNFCHLLAGSEGSLALFTEITLNLVNLPPAHTALVCIHTHSLEQALEANLIALQYQPAAVELIDKLVLDCTRSNLEQAKNRFFVKDDPEAIVVVEFAEDSPEQWIEKSRLMIAQLQKRGLGYSYPVITGQDIAKVWNLRKAGLGVLSNLPGDAKPVAVIEDTAVSVQQLPAFIGELQQILLNLNIRCVYYAHVGTGEIHIRPILDLKKRTDVIRFRQIATETAHLVKKYKGSLSGEHGDGRLRGEFIPLMLGPSIYQMLKDIKQLWDPQQIFNPGKITQTQPMDTHLRYEPGRLQVEPKTYFSYPESDGFLRAVEKCNGSGDCRKTAAFKGVMCPSYQASLNEKDTTRARANLLREIIANSSKKNPFDHPELIEILTLCLSCKACKSECPSNVDMAKFKAEVFQQYYAAHGIPWRSRLIAAYTQLNKLGSIFPSTYNFFTQNNFTAPLIKHVAGFAAKRSLPPLHKTSWRAWAQQNLDKLNQGKDPENIVVLFCDEFSNYNDTPTAIHASLLLSKLGYFLLMPPHAESGRAAFSMGMLKKAGSSLRANIHTLYPFAQAGIPIIGLEPSAILSFRDEYLALAKEDLQQMAAVLATQTLLFDEFLAHEYEKGKIQATSFTSQEQTIYLHAHCHQKALGAAHPSKQILEIPKNYKVVELDCGCCGMAGAFGYQKKTYDVSMQIAELRLFPAIRKAPDDVLISATGTSCRHQIKDGTHRTALHPADILYKALQ